MTQTSIPLGKRTKQEILDEYEKLQDELEQVRATAKTVHSPAAVELVEKVKTKTPQSIDQAFAEFQGSLRAHMTDLRATLLEQAATLDDLQRAIVISRQQLEVQHHVSVSAEALEQLLAEHASRTTNFEVDIERRKREFEEQIIAKKKTWEREAEEYEYQKRLKRERDQVENEEREKLLAVREAALRAQEQEVALMKRSIEQFPEELEASLAKQSAELTARMSQQFAHEKVLLEKETGAQIRMLELTVKNLEERLVSQAQEVSSLKQQAEEANAKAQALAIKAIERPTTIVAPAAAPVSQSAYHDRQGGRGNG